MLSSFEEHVDAIKELGGIAIKSDVYKADQISPVEAVCKAEDVTKVLGGSPQLVIILVKSRDTEKAGVFFFLLSLLFTLPLFSAKAASKVIDSDSIILR